MSLSDKIKVLDHGYVQYIGHMGSDERIIEAARMSTGKGFLGWFWEEDTYANSACSSCLEQHEWESLPVSDDPYDDPYPLPICTNCWESTVYHYNLNESIPEVLKPFQAKPRLLGRKDQPRDLNLLEFLYMNRHMTPFEMGDVCLEVKAPLMVFREWHRHRMQSYNEFSARYSKMPNEHYLPEESRFQGQSKTNKQGSGAVLDPAAAMLFRKELKRQQDDIYTHYDGFVRSGVAKEVARINTPVSRYSKMRAKTDVRNWLAFLALRMEKGAQWEIRQYANATAQIIKELFPRTFDLFIEHDFMSVRFSRTEMRELREIIRVAEKAGIDLREPTAKGMTEKKMKVLMDKLFTNKEDDYREILTKLGY
jgi:thymidylate synthase (FAD)